MVIKTMELSNSNFDNSYILEYTDYGLALYSNPERTECLATFADNGEGLLIAHRIKGVPYLRLIKPIKIVLPETIKEINKNFKAGTAFLKRTPYGRSIYAIPGEKDEDDNLISIRIFLSVEGGLASEVVELRTKPGEYWLQLEMNSKGIICNPFEEMLK